MLRPLSERPCHTAVFLMAASLAALDDVLFLVCHHLRAPTLLALSRCCRRASRICLSSIHSVTVVSQDGDPVRLFLYPNVPDTGRVDALFPRRSGLSNRPRAPGGGRATRSGRRVLLPLNFCAPPGSVAWACIG